MCHGISDPVTSPPFLDHLSTLSSYMSGGHGGTLRGRRLGGCEQVGTISHFRSTRTHTHTHTSPLLTRLPCSELLYHFLYLLLLGTWFPAWHATNLLFSSFQPLSRARPSARCLLLPPASGHEPGTLGLVLVWHSQFSCVAMGSDARLPFTAGLALQEDSRWQEPRAGNMR